MKLAEKRCTACASAERPLTRSEWEPLLEQIPHWEVKGDQKLTRSFSFKNFAGALALANKIGELAESENHHPDLLVRWAELKVDLWTHKVDGLTEADFVLAAKINEIAPQ